MLFRTEQESCGSDANLQGGKQDSVHLSACLDAQAWAPSLIVLSPLIRRKYYLNTESNVLKTIAACYSDKNRISKEVQNKREELKRVQGGAKQDPKNRSISRPY